MKCGSREERKAFFVGVKIELFGGLGFPDEIGHFGDKEYETGKRLAMWERFGCREGELIQGQSLVAEKQH